MPSDDSKDPTPGPIWHDSIPAQWNPSPDQDLPEDEGAFSYQQQQMAGPSLASQYIDAEVEDYHDDDSSFVEDLAEPASFWQQIWFYTRLIIFPLLLGSITALLVLPSVASGRAYLPQLMFWPLLVLILIIAIAQACAIFYTINFPHMWLLCTLLSLALLALIGTFTVSGPILGVILLIVVFLLFVYLTRRVFHAVPEGVVDIVFSRGKYARTLSSGFNLLLPWERVFDQVNIQEIHWLCPPQRIQLSTNEDVSLRALISYQVMPDDAHLTTTQVKHWEESLREMLVATLHTVATSFQPDDFLAWPGNLLATQGSPSHASDEDFSGGIQRRDELNHTLQTRMRDRCASWGVQVNWVQLRNIRIVPHAAPVLETDLPDVAEMPEVALHNDEPTEIFQPEALMPALMAASASGPASSKNQPRPPTSQLPPVNQLKEEMLIKLYKSVQTGVITDPASIRDIATAFEAVAQDPKVSQSVTFDAAKAARNLYEQANKYEENHQDSQFYDDKTRPDLAPPKP